MLTRCPKCKTLFRAAEADIRRAGGKTRCNKCYTVFLATESPPNAPDDTGTPDNYGQIAEDNQPRQDSQPRRGMSNAASSIYNELVIKNRNLKYDIPDVDDENADMPDLSPAQNDMAPHDITADEKPVMISEETIQRVAELNQEAKQQGVQSGLPVYEEPATHPNLRQARQPVQEAQDISYVPDALQDDLYQEVHVPSARRNTFLIFAVFIFLIVLLMQYIYFVRNDLANNVKLRPHIVKFCKAFGCAVPYKRDAKKIKIAVFVMEKHKKKKAIVDGVKREVYIITTRLVNNARFTQPFPIIDVKLFSRKDGNLIAIASLPPSKYLPRFVDIRQGFAPRTPIDVDIEFIMPFPGSPSIKLDFR